MFTSPLCLFVLTASPVQDQTLDKCTDFTTCDLYFSLHSKEAEEVTWTTVVEVSDLELYKEELFNEARSVLKQTQLKHDFDLAEVKLRWRTLPYQVPAVVMVTIVRQSHTATTAPIRDTLTLGGLPFHKISNNNVDKDLVQYSSYVNDVKEVNVTHLTAEAYQLGLGDVTVHLSTDDIDLDVVDPSKNPPFSVKRAHRDEKHAKCAKRTRTCPPRACKRLRL